MPPTGGLSDKIGNRYEGRIAVWRLVQLLDELHDLVRVRFEQPGDDHFEWWVQRADGSRTYTQVKRQQAPDKEWTIGALVSREVLAAFGERLGQEPSARCQFFSALSASHLQDLTESAVMAANLAEFEARFAAAKDKRTSWDEGVPRVARCHARAGVAGFVNPKWPHCALADSRHRRNTACDGVNGIGFIGPCCGPGR